MTDNRELPRRPSPQLEHAHHKPAEQQNPDRLLVHDIAVPMNVGSLFRIADAFGVDQLYLSGTSARPPNRKLRATSRSTEKSVRYTEIDDPAALLGDLKSDGFCIVSLELTNYSVDIRDFKYDRGDKICLIPGAENMGVSSELLSLSDQCMHIPMRGQNSSMNVAAACSIALYELSRRF